MRAHQRDNAASGIGRSLEGLAVPLHQRSLDLIALRLAVQDLADGVTVMWKVRVQPDKTPIAGFVDAGDRVPSRRGRLAADAQITLAPAFDRGVTHINGDVLRLSAAQFPDLRRG